MAGAAKPAAKKTKIVVLTLPAEVLSRFPRSAINSETGTPGLQDNAEKQSEDNATPRPTADGQEDVAALAQAGANNKKKRPAANPNARKRAPPAIDPDGPSRARPGPKKKARTDGANDSTDAAKPAAASGVPAHKLGPKANTGAINAGLRALDRSGKPCRRWEKKGLQLKSFTGSSWAMPTWKGSQRPRLNADGEVQSDSSSDAKPLDASGLASEKSASAMGDVTMMTGIESSPAPAIAAA